MHNLSPLETDTQRVLYSRLRNNGNNYHAAFMRSTTCSMLCKHHTWTQYQIAPWQYVGLTGHFFDFGTVQVQMLWCNGKPCPVQLCPIVKFFGKTLHTHAHVHVCIPYLLSPLQTSQSVPGAPTKEKIYWTGNLIFWKYFCRCVSGICVNFPTCRELTSVYYVTFKIALCSGWEASWCSWGWHTQQGE